MPFSTTWMDIEIIILSQVSQKEKDKYHMTLLIRGIFKKDTHELIYKTNRQKSNIWLAKERRGEG